MTNLLSQIKYSRIKARRMMKEKFPLLINDQIVVHHIDEDPLNNDFSNLTIISRSEHTRQHIKGRRYIHKDTLNNLESLIYLYNQGVWIDY